jgi:protocatechuate 3,4-dioxygenase beta subunit
VDEGLTRADFRSDSHTGQLQQGAPLALTFLVSRIQSSTCTPLVGAVVDVWHCNALGVYSDAEDPGFNTKGQNWLRGNLVTDASGRAGFTTFLPGWYPGRATHIHLTIRSPDSRGRRHEFTSQLFFEEGMLPSLYEGRPPYSSKGDAGRRRNEDDRVYCQGGSQLVLNPTAEGEGYAATIRIGTYTEG